jgi:hypothetical protein
MCKYCRWARNCAAGRKGCRVRKAALPAAGEDDTDVDADADADGAGDGGARAASTTEPDPEPQAAVAARAHSAAARQCFGPKRTAYDRRELVGRKPSGAAARSTHSKGACGCESAADEPGVGGARGVADGFSASTAAVAASAPSPRSSSAQQACRMRSCPARTDTKQHRSSWSASASRRLLLVSQSTTLLWKGMKHV